MSSDNDGQPISQIEVGAGALSGPKLDSSYQVLKETMGERSYFVVQCDSITRFANFPERVVPRGMVFVLGDNRDNSRDSRHFSFVPVGDVIGPAVYLYAPAASWSRFGKLD